MAKKKTDAAETGETTERAGACMVIAKQGMWRADVYWPAGATDVPAGKLTLDQVELLENDPGDNFQVRPTAAAPTTEETK